MRGSQPHREWLTSLCIHCVWPCGGQWLYTVYTTDIGGLINVPMVSIRDGFTCLLREGGKVIGLRET